MRHTHYDVQLGYTRVRLQVLECMTRTFLIIFIGSQAGPLQCRALGHSPIDRWLSPPMDMRDILNSLVCNDRLHSQWRIRHQGVVVNELDTV